MSKSGVITGIDVLERDGFKPLQGQRVGLITNHTGLTADGRSTIDVLHGAPGVKLAALFGPEHGIRGEVDQKVGDSVDAKTGLPIYSLYGETTRPKPEQLQGLDALVFDIQDVGCRYYTYISTLGSALEEAGRHKLHFVVLDRPNPVGGMRVEGPVADADRLSFVAWHPLPVRHGLTVGELARLYNVERKIGAGLIVVPCEGWRRPEWWDETSLMWVNPSPNMRSLTQAALYPGIGLLEFTNLSVGRGTDTPFEHIGAPWIAWQDGRRMAGELNGRRIPGARFVPVRFTPKSSRFANESCGGVNIVVTDRERFRPVRTGIEIAVALRRLFPEAWQPAAYDRLLVNHRAFSLLMAGESAEAIEASWKDDLAHFGEIRRKYLIYRPE
jgi:uncharacterized protein YbbC (DUF1343 family)